MTVYNKLKVAILAIISSQHLYAITLDPLQIQSAPGELLYAEMSFHQANPNAKLEVSLATPEDLLMIGAAHQPPSGLNFYTRRNAQGEGVIVMTSTRPMTDAELNIILKIQESGATHLKHIKQSMGRSTKTLSTKTAANEKSLSPKYIVSEKDIALNLPESTRFSSPTTTKITDTKEPNLKQENLLNISSAIPPALNNSQQKPSVTTAISVTTTPIPTQATVTAQTSSKIELNSNTITPAPIKVEPKPTTIINKQPPIQAMATATDTPDTSPVKKELKALDPKPVEQPEKSKKQQQPPNTAQQAKKKTPVSSNNSTAPVNNQAQQHVVQRNESLWSIAQQIAAQTQQPVAKVMTQIKAQNEHAFIGGNANRLRQGSRLNFNLNTNLTRRNTTTNQTVAQTTHPTSNKAKYRLQQAEMSLVAESNQDSSTVSAKKDTLQQKTSADLSLKVMTAREKTVTLQRNVTQLELALRTKEQRIQLLNTRLAELQNQLKAQQETKKPTR
ncbi:FimV domain-containing protein [Acinetobacter sp. ANC 4805]|uniref:FimV/HubP-related protein n=1 Tax=Acinetobacter sp. ANC 4805 TaxID=2923425 RepID=UPI001F4BC4C8|nr:FimV domain-containing protein [Acinetobacter sp. ANC 4805]MCH7311437.1 FimV domain-containing protein [Acinetobacter sp. ANC 4805]